jgi:rhodanese-related sulfurtransferase
MTTSILIKARQRQQLDQLPYAGAVTPEEAYELIQSLSEVILVDVRTNAERDWVGRVEIPSAQHFSVQWSTYPGGIPNQHFLSELEQLSPNKEAVILFLCRSGVRSRHAAKLATEHGYKAAFDILQGFEGDKDEMGHRKTMGGWCAAGLPWVGA